MLGLERHRASWAVFFPDPSREKRDDASERLSGSREPFPASSDLDPRAASLWLFAFSLRRRKPSACSSLKVGGVYHPLYRRGKPRLARLLFREGAAIRLLDSERLPYRQPYVYCEKAVVLHARKRLAFVFLLPLVLLFSLSALAS